MIKKIGFIDSMSRDGKRFKIGEDWFSAFAASQLAGIARGDYVEFSFLEKPSPTGEPYRNVKGNVTKAIPPADAVVSGAVAMKPSVAPGKPYVDSRGYVIKEFPLPAFHPDRSIIRQNSLTHAVAACSNTLETYASGMTPEDFAEKVIEVARMFEAYSSGDLDVAIVEEEMKAMLVKEM